MWVSDGRSVGRGVIDVEPFAFVALFTAVMIRSFVSPHALQSARRAAPGTLDPPPQPLQVDPRVRSIDGGDGDAVDLAELATGLPAPLGERVGGWGRG